MTTQVTQDIARRYFTAWTNRRTGETESLLDPGFTFAAAGMTISGRDAFLNANAFPADAATVLVAEAYQDDTAFQLYDSTRPDGRTVRIAEQLTINEDRIVSSAFVTDTAAFMAFLAP